jgi:hypothetical protein
LSFAKIRSPLLSPTLEMGCNVVELGYMRPRRGILKSDNILEKDSIIRGEMTGMAVWTHTGPNAANFAVIWTSVNPSTTDHSQ